MLMIPSELAEIFVPLERFDDHRAFPGALDAVYRTYRTCGAGAARNQVRNLVELFEDVYLDATVNEGVSA